MAPATSARNKRAPSADKPATSGTFGGAASVTETPTESCVEGVVVAVVVVGGPVVVDDVIDVVPTDVVVVVALVVAGVVGTAVERDVACEVVVVAATNSTWTRSMQKLPPYCV
jgi:hypothetical protein